MTKRLPKSIAALHRVRGRDASARGQRRTEHFDSVLPAHHHELVRLARRREACDLVHIRSSISGPLGPTLLIASFWTRRRIRLCREATGAPPQWPGLRGVPLPLCPSQSWRECDKSQGFGDSDPDSCHGDKIVSRLRGDRISGLHQPFPSPRTTDVMEPVFVDVRRRTRPMVCFVNVPSVDRIIYSIFYARSLTSPRSGGR